MKTKTYEAHRFPVQRTAHYYTQGQLSEATRYVWFAFHGYGQLASRLIQKFDGFGDEHVIVAPEGLSRFYWGGVHGEVAASWMTKGDRLDEIDDYCRYLSALYDHWTAANRAYRIIFFGFSQGCATMWRWIHRSNVPFDILINWAGWVPEDIDYDHLYNTLKNREMHFVAGTKDIYLTADRMAALRANVDAKGLPFRFHTFDGGHEVDRGFLHHLTDDLLGLNAS